MKYIFTALLLCCLATANGQLLKWNPGFIDENVSVVDITCDATMGNQGLLNYTPTSDVYVHLGVITNYSTSSSDWKHVPFASFSTAYPLAQCTVAGTNKWKYTINGGLRTFFGLTDPNEHILKIAILFRNSNGSSKLANADGSDMYVPVYTNNLFVRIDEPYRKPNYLGTTEPITKVVGNTVSITANASQASTMNLYFNGSIINTVSSATQITAVPTITVTGTQTIVAEAINGATTVRDTVTFSAGSIVNVAPLPTGVRDGINYNTSDPTTATLVLYAPNKTRVAVLGDFNNWTEATAAQLNQTPDGNRYWITLTGLTPGVEYAYQYLIDGSLRIADYYTEKVLDQDNDPYIPTVTYPALKAYPSTKTTGIVSILQTQKPAYTWTATSYVRPDKKNLVVYELLLRDFIARHDWQTLTDTLNYFKRLGINAIELMPINEFEGNISWGYNPSFYFAPDKYYGTETALKQFIDACHNKGIAVIMDIAMNHSFGQSPMVKMYWDAANNRPAANSPWFNPVAKHPYNVGYDFNHESQATKDFVDRVTEHWLTNYKIDGFRWDLSKGFTQVNSCTTSSCDHQSEVDNWGNYDASRIAIWKRIYDKMQSQSANAYCILEHFAANAEEIELSNYGMLLWGNGNHDFNEATMGWVPTSNFQYSIFTNRGWTNPFLVSYQESHDEERLMYKNLRYGNSSNTAYDVKNLNVGLQRNAMATAFWTMIPGPKMLWQFGELGYDSSINLCENGINKDSCRTGPKPIKWDYYQNTDRKALYDVYAKLIKLKTYPLYFNAFTTNNISYNLGGAIKTMAVTDASLKIFVIGNFDVVPQTASIVFPGAGLWYSYLTGTTKTATGTVESITLQPGEYYVYTDRNVAGTVLSLSTTTITNPRRDSSGYVDGYKVSIYPNPSAQPSTVEYSLLQSGNMQMSLTDINSKPVAVLVNGYKPKGTYKISTATAMHSKLLASGMYLLQVQFNDKKRTLKYLVTP